MINIFSAFIGILLFVEIVFVVALLKPVAEPYVIRDVWCKLLESINNPSRMLVLLLLLMFCNTFLELSYEKKSYAHLLDDVKDNQLILEFYLCKVSICYTCFFIGLYLLMLIERIVHFLVTIARLLEFELMCRHAILTREDVTQMSNTTIVLTNLYNGTINLHAKRKSATNK